MTIIVATRYHDFSYGHRVAGHENKCAHLHGHNGRVHFTVEAEGSPLDALGRVVDFSVLASTLCKWVEDHWDHRFLIFRDDPLAYRLLQLDPSVVLLAFNPTAENLARHLLLEIGPSLLARTNKGVHLVSVKFEETRKCSAVAATGFTEEGEENESDRPTAQ